MPYHTSIGGQGDIKHHVTNTHTASDQKRSSAVYKKNKATASSAADHMADQELCESSTAYNGT